MYQPFQFRRGDADEWARKDPILRDGEPGVERDTGRFKIGDGVTHWSGLEYFVAGEHSTETGGGLSSQALTNHIESETPHPVYDDGPSLLLLYENAKV